MRLILIGLLSILWVGVNAQNKSMVIGQLVDSAQQALPMASVVLLNAEDSVMHSFTITDTEGKFLLKNIEKGEYILQAGFIGYHTRSMKQSIGNNEVVDIGNLIMTEQTKLLDGVEITADRIPILFKGDTIQYNAAAFKTGTNATVEDLLKKLPGVEVDNEGNIKAQGEKVNKILVDGKEFFGNDPKIASKNLPADALENVQVFDKMSEMAEFTGIDDGQRSKTINLSLKEDKKKGIFGKISAGYGTDSRYNSSASINKFNNKTQVSFLGGINNINEQNFSFEDYINFSGGLGALGNGGVITAEVDGMPGAKGGVNISSSAGLNINHEFSEKTELSTSYFYNGVNNDLSQIRNRQNYNDNSVFITQDSVINTSDNYNHPLSMKLEHEISKGQDITIKSDVKFNDSNEDYSSNSRTDDLSGSIINSSNNLMNSASGALSYSTSLLYRIKLNDNGRNATAKLELGNAKSNLDKTINTSAFLGSGSNSITNQDQDVNSSELDYLIDISYTEPLTSNKYLTFNYERQNFNTTSSSNYYDINNGSRVFNNLLSREYNRDYYYDRAGLQLAYNSESTNLRIGSDVQSSALKGAIITENVDINKDFLNFLPSLGLRYKIDNSKHLNVNYRTSVNQPSVNQLSPTVDNSNPLRNYIGNPDLKTEYIHSASMNFSLFDRFSFTNFFANVNGQLIENKITNSTIINQDLVQTITPVNIDNELNLNGYLSFGTSVKPLGIKFNVTGTSTFVKSKLFINAIDNDIERYINSVNFRIENRKKNAVDIQTGYKITLNQTRYSDNKELNRDFINTIIYTDLSLDFLKSWNLSSSLDYELYEGDAFNATLELPIVRASISKYFLKNKRGELKLSAFDLLNKVTGISRNSSFNFVEDNRQNTVTQYYMLSFTYSLSAFGNRKGDIIIKEEGKR